MYGCTQRTARGRRERKPSSGGGDAGGSGGGGDAGGEAVVWGPGTLTRHRRGGSSGLGLCALALSGCGSSSCATLDTLARCSSSADSSAASTGGGSSAGGPGSDGPGMEPCASSVAGGSCSGQEEVEEEEEELEATAQERQLAELRGLASSLFALMTTNLVFCSREAGAGAVEEEEQGEGDVDTAAGYRCTESVYSLSPSSASAAGADSSATSPGAACSPWAAAAAGADAVASCPMPPHGFDRLRVRSNISFALGQATHEAGGASDSEDGDGEADNAHAGQHAGSWGCTAAEAGAAGVGRWGSGRCEGVYLPAWSRQSLLAAIAAPGEAAAFQEQLEAGAAAGSLPELESVERAGSGSAQRLALEPVPESPQELEGVERQELELDDRAEQQHRPWEVVEVAPLPRANTSSPFAAHPQQQAVDAGEECTHTTSSASGVTIEPQADVAGTAIDSPAAASASPEPSVPANGSARAARNGSATRQLHMPTSGRTRAATGRAVTPAASPTTTTTTATPSLSTRSPRTLHGAGAAAAGAGAVGSCSTPRTGPSPLTSPTGPRHTPSKPSPAAARPAPAAPGNTGVAPSQLRRQSSTGSSCSSYSCSSVSAAGATPRSHRQVASTAVTAAAEASLALSRRRQAREQQAAEAAAASPAPGGSRCGAGSGQQLPVSSGASSTPAPAGSPSPGPSPSYLRSTAASAARAASAMTPRAAAVHYSAAATRQ
ncbi:hypothetical protein HXX76_013007 [Chlamydomonas incerta]|uniref:Uncharacterized protein n=1 Tax=Chlamydomonas incerta TaxID=51695 RepID=A0A835SFX9_CHLIN|nr:hypothetical protein HXX76_013007 [Chlamydomonas incerta]|eukprot:KAG2426249.1 hypothetical protein HXX76_013007 [Chlamydomonas incerta]